MLNALLQALKGIKRNPVRTALTTLGIVIGIGTVIMVMSAGAGFTSYINSQVEAFGSNFATVETRVPPTTKNRASQGTGGGMGGNSASQAVAITTLKSRDVEGIQRLPNIRNAYGAVIGQRVVAYKNISKNAFIFGSSASRFQIDRGIIAEGRPYTELEDLSLAQVAILGCDIAKDFFGDQDPIGQTIRVGEFNFLVIGVYECRGSFGFSNDDQQIFIPLNTAQKKLLGIDYLFFILAQMENPELAPATAEDMRSLLRTNHGISDPAKDDFAVQTAEQGLDTFATILNAVTWLLIGIAAISLVVGGVGIMNIMYVIVTERISEIGLKKAVGAKNSDILLEFLFEAIILTLLGGVLGIGVGAGLAYVIAIVAQNFNFAWSFSVPLNGILLGVGVSMAIGLVFGVFPAYRASKLDPIEALRSE